MTILYVGTLITLALFVVLQIVVSRTNKMLAAKEVKSEREEKLEARSELEANEPLVLGSGESVPSGTAYFGRYSSTPILKAQTGRWRDYLHASEPLQTAYSSFPDEPVRASLEERLSDVPGGYLKVESTSEPQGRVKPKRKRSGAAARKSN